MAIYHLHVKTFSRSKGDSAVAACAYRLGVSLKDECTDRTHDYAKRKGVWGGFSCAPDHAPAWAHDPGACWQKAEAAEKRKDACIAREFEFSLPLELTPAQNKALARDVAQHLVTRFGFVVTVGLHDLDTQPHAHVLASTRQIGTDGFGAKTRELDDRTSGAVDEVRALIAARTNEALRAADHQVRVDHRSNAAQQADAIARGDLTRALELDGKVVTVHEGKGPRARQRRTRNREVKEQNADRAKRLVTALEVSSDTEPMPPRPQAAETPQNTATAPQALNQPGDDSMNITPITAQEVEFTESAAAFFASDEEPEHGSARYAGLLTEQAYAWALQLYGRPTHFRTLDPSPAILTFADGSTITDHGKTLKASSGAVRDQARRVCALALAKNWTGIVFNGNEAFLRAAFEEALRHNLTIHPRDDEQRALLARIEKEKRAAPKLLTRAAIASKLDSHEREKQTETPAPPRRCPGFQGRF